MKLSRFMERLVYAAGGAMIFIVLAILFYLAHESRYAFSRTFGYGYRFAAQPTHGEFEHDLTLDPNATLLTANREGADGIDEKEEGITAPTLEMLSGGTSLATGTIPTAGAPATPAVDDSGIMHSEGVPAETQELYRDDWRALKKADQGQTFKLYAFAAPSYTEKEMVIAWQADETFVPQSSPFDLRLRLVKAPAGIDLPKLEINLKKQPSGSLRLPTYIAHNDAERSQGYEFEMVAIPTTSNTAATLAGFASTKWDPTLSYASFGMLPLLIGTLLMALLAVLIATPIAIPCALYLSEMASPKLREWLKIVVELLASVPTVVLGYFGLMLVAPFLQNTIAKAFGLESGRALLTVSIMMAVLLLPTLVSLAEDALRSLPDNLREGGEALGLTVRERLKMIILPAAKSMLSVAVLLGFARAIGETMIVWILSGGTPGMPSFRSGGDALANLMRPVRGIPDTIAIEMGNVSFEDVHYGHLFLLGLALFVFTLAINLIGFRIARRSAWRS